MSKASVEHNRKLLFLIAELCQAARFCRQDSVFCEGVTFSQFLILDALATREGLKMADLHSVLAVEKSTTTRLIRPLIERELVQREKAEHDLRATYLRITPAGKETYRRVWDCFTEFAGTIRGKIPENDMNDVYRTLRIFIDAIRDTSSVCACNSNDSRELKNERSEFNII
ncbi:MAG: winged helix DNA-binding protein [Deltaproteobacteria bacterium]|nr:winged helix DNA-binding protein [Deltaproteobacteria bacterium]MBW2594909.1 winged helix DNA-binding protein [Deltaproteobacteria bacterium]MBW2650321.1 winged helix DNA-binding protein [Deltaproteobacteria bacterium]